MNMETGCLNNCIETHSGIAFDLIEPSGPVLIEDIAHALAHLCRFGGHTDRHYSVAEHSIHVHALIVMDYGYGPLSLAGLLHDAEEAYLGDMVLPLKIHNPTFSAIGDRLQAYIRQAFNISWDDEIARIVKHYDKIALRSEAKELMPSRGSDWQWGDTPFVEVEIVGYSPKLAKQLFLETYHRYQ